jgi:hypothetical protein
VVVKLGDVMMIVDLHRKGLTVSAIARQTGFDRRVPCGSPVLIETPAQPASPPTSPSTDSALMRDC